MLRVILEVATHKENTLLKVCKFPKNSDSATGSEKIVVLKSFANFTGKGLC